MPSLELITNVKVKDPEAFSLEFSKIGAAALGKPEAYITTSVTYNATLTFGGSFDPAFNLTVISLDNLNDSANEEYSRKFFDFFKEKLGVPGDRGYIMFVDPGRGSLGHQGTTFATIFAK